MKTIEIDSQHLNGIQACFTKHHYQFSENLSPMKKAAPLEKGSLLHKVLELYDGLMAKCHDLESDTWQELAETDLVEKLANKLEPTKRDIIDFCLAAGQFFAIKLDTDPEELDNVLFQFNAYCEYYTNDPWETLAVEQVGSKVLFENSELRIIYVGKIDRLVQQGRIIAPMDHKSSDRRGDVSSLSNQFISYCFLLSTNHIIIDKIGFQKSLKPGERFQRYHLIIDDARIEEWRINTVMTMLNYLSLTVENELEAAGYFFMLRELRELKNHKMMNLTSCDKYSGCTYKEICSGNPEGRDWTKERDFVVREPWDVATILETTK